MHYPGFQTLLSLIPQDSHSCLPSPTPPRLHHVLSRPPPLGGPPFPHSLWHHCPPPGIQRKPATSEARQAGTIPTAIIHGLQHQPALLEAAQMPPTLRVTSKPEPPVACEAWKTTHSRTRTPPPWGLTLHRGLTQTPTSHTVLHTKATLGGILQPPPLDENNAIEDTDHLTLSLPESSEPLVWHHDQMPCDRAERRAEP